MMDKIAAWFRHSATIVWARIVASVGLVLMALESLLQDPAVSQAIQSMLQPKYVPYYVIAIGLITELTRRRTLDRN